jgi:hypothetical protein
MFIKLYGIVREFNGIIGSYISYIYEYSVDTKNVFRVTSNIEFNNHIFLEKNDLKITSVIVHFLEGNEIKKIETIGECDDIICLLNLEKPEINTEYEKYKFDKNYCY